MAAVAATQAGRALLRRVTFDSDGMTLDHLSGSVLEGCGIAPQSGKSIVAEPAGHETGSRTRRAIRVRGRLRSVGMFSGEGDGNMLVRFGARTEITPHAIAPPGPVRRVGQRGNGGSGRSQERRR